MMLYLFHKITRELKKAAYYGCTAQALFNKMFTLKMN